MYVQVVFPTIKGNAANPGMQAYDAHDIQKVLSWLGGYMDKNGRVMTFSAKQYTYTCEHFSPIEGDWAYVDASGKVALVKIVAVDVPVPTPGQVYKSILTLMDLSNMRKAQASAVEEVAQDFANDVWSSMSLRKQLNTIQDSGLHEASADATTFIKALDEIALPGKIKEAKKKVKNAKGNILTVRARAHNAMDHAWKNLSDDERMACLLCVEHKFLHMIRGHKNNLTTALVQLSQAEQHLNDLNELKGNK